MAEHDKVPDRPIFSGSPKKRGPAFWTAAGTLIAGAVVALAQSGLFAGVFAGPAQAREKREEKTVVVQQKTLDEKIDGLVNSQAEVASDVREIKSVQARQTTDIAVIKRQLGLDGLGPPPIAASGVGR